MEEAGSQSQQGAGTQAAAESESTDSLQVLRTLISDRDDKIDRLQSRLWFSRMINVIAIVFLVVMIKNCSFKSDDYLERLRQDADQKEVLALIADAHCYKILHDKSAPSALQAKCREYSSGSASTFANDADYQYPQPPMESPKNTTSPAPAMKFINSGVPLTPSDGGQDQAAAPANGAEAPAAAAPDDSAEAPQEEVQTGDTPAEAPQVEEPSKEEQAPDGSSGFPHRRKKK